MKSVRRIGCWTVLALIVALGTLVILFTPFRQKGAGYSGREVRGNAAILGGDVTIGQDEYVKGNLLVVGDDLTLEGQIGGNLVVVGGDADLVAHSRVGGNVSVIGGDAVVSQASQVGGNIAVVGGDASLSGNSRVGGHVNVIGGRISEEPDVHIGGNISWRIYPNSVAHPGLHAAPRLNGAEGQSGFQQPVPPQQPVTPQQEAHIAVAEFQSQAARMQEQAQGAADEARSQAAQHRIEAQRAADAARAQFATHRPPWFIRFLGKLAQAFLWTLLITGLVLLFAWLLPKQVERITQTAQRETALSFAAGAITVMGTALLAVILTITICFALLSLPLLALLALVILCGWTVTCYWLGSRLDALLASRSTLSWNPLVSVAFCSLFITGVTTFAWAIFTCLGFFVALLIGSTGIGAVIVHLARNSGRRSNGAPLTDPDAPEPGGKPAPTAGETNEAGSPAATVIAAEANGTPSETADDTATTAQRPETGEPAPAEIPPTAAPRPHGPDDLTRLAGVGPTFAQRLRNAGVTTFAQLAAREPEQIAEALGWSASRVERERLRERAAELAAQE